MKSLRTLAILWLWLIQMVLPSQLCMGDQLSLAPNPEPVDWVSGPAKASLGAFAEIEIPRGYRFADATGARVLLERMKNPVPKNLVGILAPYSGSSWVILEFSEAGYVKAEDVDRLDAAEVLKAMWTRVERQNEERTRNGLMPITLVDWELKPVYDPAEHALEWALRAESQSGTVVNHTVLLLGRSGALSAIAVRPYHGSADLTQLKQLMKGITFKEGERYADYQDGDKIATTSLAKLITGDDSLAGSKDAVVRLSESEPVEGKGSWASFVVFGCVVGCAGVGAALLGRKLRRMKKHAVSQSIAQPAGTDATPSVEAGSEVGGPKPKTEPVGGPAEALRNKRRFTRRRKVFDYHKFYTDMVLQVSHTSEAETSAPGWSPYDAGRVIYVLSQDGGASQAVPGANSDLISNQKSLIEEQKRLIQEQTKLIEEKTKLIKEKNQLLDRQAELIESHIL